MSGILNPETLSAYQGGVTASNSLLGKVGNIDILSSLTKVRACLLLSRMHEKLGNREKCIEFANLGIKLAGMAVGPKKALKDILSRLSV